MFLINLFVFFLMFLERRGLCLIYPRTYTTKKQGDTLFNILVWPINVYIALQCQNNWVGCDIFLMHNRSSAKPGLLHVFELLFFFKFIFCWYSVIRLEFADVNSRKFSIKKNWICTSYSLHECVLQYTYTNAGMSFIGDADEMKFVLFPFHLHPIFNCLNSSFRGVCLDMNISY